MYLFFSLECVNPHFVQAFMPLNAFTNHQEAYICPARFKVVIDNLYRMRKNLYLYRIPVLRKSLISSG